MRRAPHEWQNPRRLRLLRQQLVVAALAARATVDEPDRAWAEARLARLRYGARWLLPQAAVHWRRVADRSAELPAIS